MKSKTSSKKTIVVNGQKLTANKDGEFRIDPPQFGKHDLSTLPAGTHLSVGMRNPLRPTDTAWIVGIIVSPNNKVEALGFHFLGINRPATIISHEKYFDIAQKLLKERAATNQNLKCLGVGMSNLGPILSFLLGVQTVTFADIQREVRDLIRTILQPLWDFQRDSRNESKRRFGF